ncbi:hypothetical protein ABZ234_08385 [Nocardiopsis sp. NPDC006198]|uniref:hypothetical protein n=1 Tax=Nocardiopsis sp. NPDC006198 TaxID=3154472 RepID=UPI0033AF62EA
MGATVVILGVLFALGPWVRHPAPDFLTEIDDQPLQIEVELGEEHIGELGVYGRAFGFGCSFTNPSGTMAQTQIRGASSFDYGGGEWNLVQVVEITESGTHEIACNNQGVEAGIASMDVVESAPARQMLWGITWVSLPALGLITTVAIALVTLVRARRQKAAAPSPR